MESMQCNAVEWNGIESMECNAVEWNGMDAFWVILVMLCTFGYFWTLIDPKNAKSKTKTPFSAAYQTSLMFFNFFG